MKLNRRQFVGMGAAGAAALGRLGQALAAGTADDAAGRPWAGWTKGRFQVHFIYTGVAESMFWILPDGTTMLLDCGDHPALTRGPKSVPVLPGPERLAGEWIARYVRRVNPSGDKVDYMMLSHYHADHGGAICWQSSGPGRPGGGVYRSGFGLAAEQLHFARAIDRSWPDFNDPIPKIDDSYHVVDHMKRVYAWLQKRDGLKIEKFRLGATDQIVPLKDPAACAGFTVRNLCANGRIAAADGTVRDLYAPLIAQRHPKNLNENGMSLGVVATYGAFSLYTAGDFSDKWRLPDGTVVSVEDEIADVVGPVQVAKVNHHGHHSMPEKLVKALAARVWVGCVWDQMHMLDHVCARLADTSLYPGERVICPGVFPAERRAEDAGKPWLAAVAPATFEGSHIVLDVPPGGRDYSVSFLSAADESMTVKSVLRLQS